MKVAICISGGVRYPHLGAQSIENIIPNDNLKIFIHTWKISDIEEFNSTLFSTEYKEQGKYIESNNNFLDLYDYEKILIEDYSSKKKEFDLVYKSLPSRFYENSPWYYNNQGGITYARKDVGPLSMHYSIHKANELKKQYENENNMIFDCVVRMRFDSDFCEKDLNLIQFLGDFYIPDGEDYCGGINDQFAFGPSYMMDIYSNLYNNISKIENCTYQPESMLRKYLNDAKVPVKRLPFFVRINNGIDFRKVLFSGY